MSEPTEPKVWVNRSNVPNYIGHWDRRRNGTQMYRCLAPESWTKRTPHPRPSKEFSRALVFRQLFSTMLPGLEPIGMNTCQANRKPTPKKRPSPGKFY